MAYDEDLADRVRELIAPDDPVEKKMFGGLAFMVGGNLAVAVRGKGGLLVRVEKDRWERLLSREDAEPMIMQGSEARGWLMIAAEHLKTKRQLSVWVERGASYARSLPRK